MPQTASKFIKTSLEANFLPLFFSESVCHGSIYIKKKTIFSKNFLFINLFLFFSLANIFFLSLGPFVPLNMNALHEFDYTDLNIKESSFGNLELCINKYNNTKTAISSWLWIFTHWIYSRTILYKPPLNCFKFIYFVPILSLSLSLSLSLFILCKYKYCRYILNACWISCKIFN